MEKNEAAANDQPALNELSPTDLDALEVSATEAFDALNGKEALTAEEIAELQTLADSVNAVRAEKESRAAETEKLNEQRAALAAQVHPAEASDAPAEGEGDEGGEGAPAPDPAEAPEADPGEEAPVEGKGAKVPVAASAAPRVNLGAIRRHAPVRSTNPVEQRGNGVTITAAADIPGVPMSTKFTTLAEVGAAMAARARVLPVVAGGGQMVPVASIDLGIPKELWLGNNDELNTEIINEARKPSALTAAGWCAPMQQTYDFFSIESTDGLIDLPTVGTERGAISWPVSPTMADVQSALWTWTEEQDIAAAAGSGPSGMLLEKPCLYIPCATFDDCTLSAQGLCLTTSNLTERGYPELVRRYVQLVTAAHAHRVSGLIVDAMTDLAVDVTIGANVLTGDAFGDLMGAVDLQAADYRSQFAMSDNAILEIVLPQWTKEILRSNLAQRNGVDNMLSVTDEQITAHFRERKVRPQFVFSYQPLFDTAPATQWPTELKFLIYAAGTYVKASGGTLDLGVVRDSTLNATNDHVAAWSEEFYCIGMVGHAAREVTVTMTINGFTGGQTNVVGATGPTGATGATGPSGA